MSLSGKRVRDGPRPRLLTDNTTGNPLELLETLSKEEKLIANKSAKAGLDDMGLLFRYLRAFGVLDKARRPLWRTSH